MSGGPQGYVDPNFPSPMGDGDSRIIIYGYTPSYPLAIAAAVIFSISLLLHAFQLYRYRTWYFCTVPIALTLEILGWIFRSFSANKNPYSVIYFVLQYFFIVCAPVFLSAGIYAILSVLITRVGKEFSPIAPKVILAIFITSDAVCTVVQVAGAALIGSSESNDKDPTTGNNILLAGLAVQVFVFLIFLLLTFWFMMRAKKVIWYRGRRGFLVAFVAATLLVYLRTSFRLAETAQGVMSYLFTHEEFFAGLEFAPIAAAVLLFNVWHPGRCLKKNIGFEEDV